jgi:hypothetical protein
MLRLCGATSHITLLDEAVIVATPDAGIDRGWETGLRPACEFDFPTTNSDEPLDGSCWNARG